MKHMSRLLAVIFLAALLHSASAAAQIVVSPEAPTTGAVKPDSNNSAGNDGKDAKDKTSTTTQRGYQTYMGAPNMNDPAMHSCGDSNDCTVVTPPCNPPIAINRNSLPLVQDWYDSMRTQMNCGNQPSADSTAVCSPAHTCIIARPGQNGVPRRDNPGYCDTNDDCTMVTDACGRKKAVNAANAGAQAPANSSSANCSYTDQSKVKSMQCKNHLCTATFSNY